MFDIAELPDHQTSLSPCLIDCSNFHLYVLASLTDLQKTGNRAQWLAEHKDYQSTRELRSWLAENWTVGERLVPVSEITDSNAITFPFSPQRLSE